MWRWRLPYVIVVVAARLQTFDPQLEEAARSLGASQWVVTRDVTLPWIASGVVAGALFAFAVSFDQFVVSYFLAAARRCDAAGRDLHGDPQGLHARDQRDLDDHHRDLHGGDAGGIPVLQVRRGALMSEVSVRNLSLAYGTIEGAR